MEGKTENEEAGMKPYLSSYSSSPSSSSSSSSWWRQHWSSLKPFVNGGIVGFIKGFITWAPYASLYNPTVAARYRNNPKLQILHMHMKIFPGMIPCLILVDTLATSQVLGIFDILRRKAIATNDGMPPSLIQEAACGLAAGAVGAHIRIPLFLYQMYNYDKQVNRTGPAAVNVAEPWSKRGLSELWRKFGRRYARERTALDFGMLASYNPSLHHLKESCGFSQTQSQIGASAISAFCATACVATVRNSKSLEGGLKILKSRGPLALLTGFSRLFRGEMPIIMGMWGVLEVIKART